MWPMIAAMAGMSLLQNMNQQNQYQQDAKLAAETTRYSPFTGMKSQMPGRPQPGISAVLGGALQGASVANAFSDADLDRQLKEKLLKGDAQTTAASLDNAPGLEAPKGSMLMGDSGPEPVASSRGSPIGGYLMDADPSMTGGSEEPATLYGSMLRQRRATRNRGASGSW